MKQQTKWFFILLSFLFLAPEVATQPVQQAKRHSFVFNMGSWSVAQDVNASLNQSVDSRTGGFVGTISHRFWLTDNWAIGPYLSFFDLGEASEDEPIRMTSLVFSITYSFPTSTLIPNSRFYLSVGFGPYMSSTIENTSENGEKDEPMSVSVFGMRPMSGMDWHFGNWFLFNMSFGYHLIPNFSEPIGDISNFSGAEVSMGLGVIL